MTVRNVDGLFFDDAGHPLTDYHYRITDYDSAGEPLSAVWMEEHRMTDGDLRWDRLRRRFRRSF